MTEPNLKRKCLYSGEEFIPRRNNQVFASSKNRISFHNKKNNKLRNELKGTSKQLLKNYQICSELLGNKSNTIIHSEFLKGKGFDFKYYTGMDNPINHLQVFCIFGLKYTKIDENNYKISK